MIDGIDHINVYSKGNTALGRELSNFAHTRFPLDGEMFESVEGWWYYKKTGDIRLKYMHGYQAKKLGSKLPVLPEYTPPTKEELKRVYFAKLNNNPKLKAAVISSSLPFDHYYEYGGKRVDTEWRWTGELWNEVREELIEQLSTIHTSKPIC